MTPKSFLLKHYCTIILFIVGLGSALANSISYAFNPSCSFEIHDDLEYKLVQDQLINDGVLEGCLIIKLDLEASPRGTIVSLPYPRLEHIEASIITGNASIIVLPNERFLSYEIKGEHSVSALIQIQSYHCAYIPIQIAASTNFAKQEKRNLLGVGFYYGFALMMFILNVLLYFYFSDRTFLLYSIFLLVISLNLWYEDGVLHFLNFPFEYSTYYDVILHWLVPFTCTLFTWEYMQFRIYLPRIKYVLGLTLFISATFYIAFLVSSRPIFLGWGDIWSVISLFVIQTGGYLLFNKSKFARLFVFAYLFILICGFDIYVPKVHGWTFLGLSQFHFKIGGLIEMNIFFWAIIYRMNQLRQENEFFKVEIKRMIDELGNANKATTQSIDDKLKAVGMTARQMQILDHLRKGDSNKEIAKQMYISVNTVKFHTKNIYQKLGINSRTEVIV